PEVERAEVEAFLEDVYSRELAYEYETPATVTFPSGAALQVVSGPTGKGEEHYDPHQTGNPLLDTSAPVRSTALSTSFTVGELTRSGGRTFDKARIDPELVRCLQRLRDHVGRPVHVISGYRPFLYNVELYTKTYKKQPTQSYHSSGQAADVKIAGMSGMEIAKAAIDAGNTKLGLGIDDDNAHIDVRGTWTFWAYFRDDEQNKRAVAEIGAYQRQRAGGTAAPAAPAPAATGAAPAAGLAGQMLEAVGRGLWDVAVRLAIDSGITDVTQLTNTLFYLRHPDMRGKRIEAGQGDLPREWIEIRDRWVKPALAGRAASPGPAAPPGMPSVRLKRTKNGYAAYGGGRLEDSLRRLVRAGTLSISERDIDTLQRIADVESTGLTNALNSWDNAVMSIGFKQWTLRWGELQDLISRAPEAFARHGIRLAPPGTNYTFGPSGKTWTKRAIDGVPDKETLRNEEWGRRFFLAALEPEAVAAAANKALEDVRKLEQHVKATYGWSPHFESPRGRALLAELDNNRPAYVRIVVPRVLARAKERPGIDEEALLEIFVEEIVAAYQSKEKDAAKGRRWTSKIMRR
ncbi:MAG TPA: D-Ala-D-Ala carboxypeptidase family metallohydrolase, partial [Gaiellaceae bacterium]|nr:D-Ala-D-Ala carboxypeptidase family metallohydrolase [Gaiellaceae bacterium]